MQFARALWKAKLKDSSSKIAKLESTSESLKAKLSAEVKKSADLQKRVDQEIRARTSEKKKLSNLVEQVDSYSAKSEELVSALAGEKDGNAMMSRKLELALKEKEAAIERVRTFDQREAELVRKLNFMDEVRKKLHNRVMQLTGNIRVFVRVRPPLLHEQELIETAIQKKNLSMSEMPFSFPGVCEGADGIDSTKRLLEVKEPWKDRGGLKPRRKTWR